jgi:hypothetical protein
MDDEPVLRELGAALERDDPRLAALLSAGPSLAGRRVLAGAPPVPPAPPSLRPIADVSGRRRRPPGWVLWPAVVLAVVLVVLASIRLGLAAFGVLGISLLMLSPVVACLWCATAAELRPPDRPAGG